MPEINLTNPAGRDAVVGLTSVRHKVNVRWLDEKSRQANSARVLRAPVSRDFDALMNGKESASEVGQAILEGDPEIDFELTGSFLRETSRVYINQSRSLVHKVQQWEIIRKPDGTERERRPRVMTQTNISGEVPPLKWTGVLIKKSDAIRKFVFSGKMQLYHVSGLTYDFLYGIAKELEEKQSLLALGAGPKGNQPLVLRRGGTTYRGFLEGRTDGDRYCLILHLTNLELKLPSE